MSMNPDRREGPPVFAIPDGFSCNTTIADKTTIFDYEAAGMAVPKPGEYVMNNGVIAVATTEGKIAVWVPNTGEMQTGVQDETRTVAADKALENAKKMGYTEGHWGVPTIL